MRKKLIAIAIIGVLVIFTAGMLGISVVSYNNAREELRQTDEKIGILQDVLEHNLAAYESDYANSVTAYKELESRYEELKANPPTTVTFRYPNTPPYEAFPDPITFEQALLLLYGMRTSHEQALNWTFESSPGFGIDDREFQLQVIKWYDQLIDYIWTHKRKLLLFYLPFGNRLCPGSLIKWTLAERTLTRIQFLF